MRSRVIVFVVASFAFSAAAQASSTLRVGNQVLTAGDSAARVQELLGRPSYKSRHGHARGGSRRGRRHGTEVRGNAADGEHWQYRRDGHVTTVIIVDGKVTDIDDRRL